jgi:hypothetical protein
VAIAVLFPLSASSGLFKSAPKPEIAALTTRTPAPATPIAYLPFLPSTGAWDRVFNTPQRAPQVAALPVAKSAQPRASASALPESYARSIESGLVESWSERGTEKFVLAGPPLAGAKGCRNFLVWENGGGLGTAATIRKCAAGSGLAREP